ncbi:MAG: hypothetical protein AAGH74_09185 [Pseudomonadota bacterium]
MAREIFTIDTYRATITPVMQGSESDDFTMWCYSEILEKRGIRHRYEVFIDSTNPSYSLIYLLPGSGSTDRRIIIVLNLSARQIDRTYNLLSTEKPVRMRIDHDGGSLLDETEEGIGYNRISELRIYTGTEPVGEAEGESRVFPE